MLETKQRKLSVVVPVFNEAGLIDELIKEIVKAFKKTEYEYELILVNDGSTDNSDQKIATAAKKDKNIVSLNFSRNFGKEIALTAGLHHCGGEGAIMLDADLQHPPSLIPKFIEAWEKGADVVVGIRADKSSGTRVKRIGSKIYYWLINKMSETEVTRNSTDYRLLDRRVVESFNMMGEHNRITRGLIDWLGFKRTLIEFESPNRSVGEATLQLQKTSKACDR